jgi:hypothetical protein
LHLLKDAVRIGFLKIMCGISEHEAKLITQRGIANEVDGVGWRAAIGLMILGLVGVHDSRDSEDSDHLTDGDDGEETVSVSFFSYLRFVFFVKRNPF